ncbi:pantoate--beta-alanine ligase [Cesiribacter andamanensis]|uniref:Pantothenate synthetase n=1 Tax=Cesiribacter andamanensis AMV16 TaxID=1279009 RepID=M7N9G9_9BACT|nr:pantoate--beta-alanine ligase [Cesiribacter andamanensis]EMR03836.1 Pantothenate synthetase [Cesiribacter andamanensis AMV16]
MLVFRKKEALRQHLQEQRRSGTTLGLVPTMGALHQGHLSLLQHALASCGHVVCSVFVNPTQFTRAEDLEKYPRMPEQDLALLEAAGCHTVFLPEVEEMYPSQALTHMHFGPLEAVMEGRYRPGHFSGVGLVVSKLFNIVQPDKAFFGQKDLQQCRIIEQLVRDLSFPIEITLVPTLREADGLALSSRNMRLSAAGRQTATHLHQALQQAARALQEGASPQTAQNGALSYLQGVPELEPEYFCIVEGGTLQELDTVLQAESVALCVAAYVEGVRLIDNLLLAPYTITTTTTRP